jgi:AraC-like DNA-binding protein
MRSLYIRPDAAPQLPTRAHAVGVSGLLRELILAATEVEQPYDLDSRDGRLMRLLLDELHALPVLPLHLPQPADARLRRICARIAEQPDDLSTLADWAAALGIDAKTIQRLFARETGMTFGQWRQQARLLHGLERLAIGDKVVDVALALGYDSPSAFAAMFKRQFGETPSAFFR